MTKIWVSASGQSTPYIIESKRLNNRIYSKPDGLAPENAVWGASFAF
jgi:hypothetical protein